MASSRIFIKGLPPNINEEDFKKHFSRGKSQITDSKLIPNRRIGYIGFKTTEEAEAAVIYFNKSFIRMSKIAVEIARPIADVELPTSRKALREQAREAQKLRNEKRAVAEEANNLKRKRTTEANVTDSKLQEFLEVMQPASKSRTWNTNANDNLDQEPPMKIQAMEMPENESDEEYEAVPTVKRTEKAIIEPVESQPIVATPIVQEAVVTSDATMTEAPSTIDAKDDDDWLRSRTSRLLDIVDVDDLPTPRVAQISSTIPTQRAPTPPVRTPDVKHAKSPVIDDVTQSAEHIEDDIQDEQADIAEATDATIEQIKSTGRLFIRNLPYTATEDELSQHFSKYGNLEEIHLALDKGVSKGFCFIQYEDHDAAAEAFHNLDGETFQGRLLHIVPATSKRENKLDEFAISKLPLKKQNEIKRKAELNKGKFDWNSLYLNQDAVNSSMAQRLGISKSELLDHTSSSAGVKQAIAETSIIAETKAYFAKAGVDLNAFKGKERGDEAILVKNFPFGTSVEELRTMFEEYGRVTRVLMPPTGVIAIVEFAEAPACRTAYKALAYRRLKTSILYLEKAPKNLFTTAAPQLAEDNGVKAISATDLLSIDQLENPEGSTTLFISNLNFTTTTAILHTLFKPLPGFLTASVKTKTDPKKPGQVLSMGFGFAEFSSKAQARSALAAMQGYTLEGHQLKIKESHKGADAAEAARKEAAAKKKTAHQTKLVVKNLPFEADKKDIRALFETYGKLRSVRMPQKFDKSARGFAFVDFVTPREAEGAMESLRNTHLLGRRLVIDFAATEAVDAEEEIERMTKKVGKQVGKMEREKLLGGRKNRSKLLIEGIGED